MQAQSAVPATTGAGQQQVDEMVSLIPNLERLAPLLVERLPPMVDLVCDGQDIQFNPTSADFDQLTSEIVGHVKALCP